MQDWKLTDEIAGVDIAGLEIEELEVDELEIAGLKTDGLKIRLIADQLTAMSSFCFLSLSLIINRVISAPSEVHHVHENTD